MSRCEKYSHQHHFGISRLHSAKLYGSMTKSKQPQILLGCSKSHSLLSSEMNIYHHVTNFFILGSAASQLTGKKGNVRELQRSRHCVVLSFKLSSKLRYLFNLLSAIYVFALDRPKKQGNSKAKYDDLRAKFSI